jgi:hypothetical protein
MTPISRVNNAAILSAIRVFNGPSIVAILPNVASLAPKIRVVDAGK